MTDCRPGNTAPTSLIRTSILPARLSARTRASARCAAWTSPACTPTAANPRPTRWSRGISSGALLPIAAVGPFRAELLQNRLNRRVGLQQSRAHDVTEFATRLPKFFPGSLNDWVHHCLLMRGAETGAFILGQVRQ